MRILQVITDTDRRGAQVFASDLQQAVAGKGHEVTTVALRAGAQRPALDVEVLGQRSRGLRTLQRLRAEMARVDVTIAHGSATGLACALAGGRRRPFVYRQISDTKFWANTIGRRIRVSCYLRRARAVVALSEGAKSDLVDHLRLSSSLIHVVPNGVPAGDLRRFSTAERNEAKARFGLDPSVLTLLYIGALVPEKGVDLAIRAIATVDGTELLIVGDGPQRTELEALALSAACDRVRFAGVLTDVAEAYRSADLVLLPSKGGDSMPATLIEAGYCELPSIATPIGSIEEIVLDGETGMIVAADDVHALTGAIDCLANDAATRAAFGVRAREHCCESFEIGVVADRWLALLGQFAGRSSSAKLVGSRKLR